MKKIYVELPAVEVKNRTSGSIWSDGENYYMITDGDYGLVNLATGVESAYEDAENLVFVADGLTFKKP